MPKPNRIKSISDSIDSENDASGKGWGVRPEVECSVPPLNEFARAGVSGVAGVFMLEQTAQTHWVEGFTAAVKGFTELARIRSQNFDQIGSLASEVAVLRQKVESISDARSIHAIISTLAPSKLQLLRDVPITITHSDGDCTATLFDACIVATGDSELEAIFNIKDMIVETFQALVRLPERKLGKVPRHQLAALRTFIKEA